MTTDFHGLGPVAEGGRPPGLQVSNGFVSWIMRHRLLMSAGYFALGFDEERAERFWVPESSKRSAHDGWIVTAEQIPGVRAATSTLLLALEYGLEHRRPWLTAEDEHQLPVLRSFLDFLDECGGFETS